MVAPPEQTYPTTASFKLPYLKDGLHVACLPVSDDLFELIGRVAAHWGSFEFHFNQCLAALIAAGEGEVRAGWEKSGFKTRKELFLSLATSLFSESEIAPLRKVCGDAANLHWRRNLVVHGAYAMTIPPNSSLAAFRAEGVVKGRMVRVSLNHATLEKLWHDLAHLDAALKHAVEPFLWLEGYWPTLPDRELLRVYRETNHPWNPNPDKRSPRPESSPLSLESPPPRPAGE